ncbi:hypothetical protein KQI42_16825 [Tissierella sp. MSJ-40]|uniref:Lipoprotein n=1 Tax=Tissierella simiarum TaxID=2841534 RepID=A0ABS6E9U3_9FIRM|nr:hypothetical protein [Tissierella simiarum]MBU5439681.1 hypothetical protein [Tissierella simiarum]
MKSNSVLKKLTGIVIVCILLICLVACSANNDNKEIIESDLNQDKELTSKLLEEKEVLSGQVYIRDDLIIGAIVIKDRVSEDRAKKLAQKYAEELKDKYKDKKINVQAVQDYKNIVNIEE